MYFGYTIVLYVKSAYPERRSLLFTPFSVTEDLLIWFIRLCSMFPDCQTYADHTNQKTPENQGSAFPYFPEAGSVISYSLHWYSRNKYSHVDCTLD